MNGILHILDQAGTGLMQLQQENAALRERITSLEAQIARSEGESQDLTTGKD